MENREKFTKLRICFQTVGVISNLFSAARQVHNDLALGKLQGVSSQFKAANLYFIREYCYGSMFRYNKKGAFNIPYGGMSYNRKDMGGKIDRIFSQDMQRLFWNTDIHCADFETFLRGIQPTEEDLMFLDPPYDTDFADYEGRNFARADQERLAETLFQTPARFILVIKNTPFSHSLYEEKFRILRFNKRYAYNVRQRNNRDAEHLIITNLPG